jgi:chloramphenicol-sensitive protein RarD
LRGQVGHAVASLLMPADSPPRSELRLGVQAGILAYLLWACLTVYWKQLTAFDAFELIAWRILAAAVVMAIVVSVRGRWSVLRAAARSRRLVGRIALAAVLLTINWTSYVYAVVDGRVIETALGYFMAPLGTMILGIVVFHERPRPLQKVALACAVVAVVVLTATYGEPPLLALLIAVSWSLYGLLKRQIPLTAIESLAGETFVLVLPALVTVMVMAGREDSIPSSATAGEWVLVAGTGVVTAVPLLLFAIAAQRVPFQILGPLQYLVPTINFILGWLVYDESLPPERLMGFAVVWIGLACTAVDQVRAARTVQPAAERSVPEHPPMDSLRPGR